MEPIEPMEQARWQLIKAIFQAALDREPAERRAFVAVVCGQDEALQREVEAMLAAEVALPPQPAPHDGLLARLLQQVQAVEGTRIGPYQVIRELGRGGMGAVYLAERADDQFRQRVAVKLIRHDLEHEEVLRRFRYERQILAALEHPNIARLLDGGATEDGTPFFALEYIEGQPLDEYCRTHKLTIPQRLELFRTVCRAVQYAHQNLIIHRDLKPSNILVTADGVPKLLDFGIAKLLDPTQFDLSSVETQPSQRLMTPAYASPEQVRGQPLTTASDVYALGVILYELLTGQRPYQLKGLSVGEIERAICDSEPVRPSDVLAPAARERRHLAAILQASLPTRAMPPAAATQAGVVDGVRAAGLDPERAWRQLQGDLDKIVMMALRKEPQRRYASVEQLSEDLRRHLTGLPVTAQSNSFVYRSGKFIRRHKAGVLVLGLIFLSLIGGLFITLRELYTSNWNEVRNKQMRTYHDFEEKIEEIADSHEKLGFLLHLRGESEAALVRYRLAAELREECVRVVYRVYEHLGAGLLAGSTTRKLANAYWHIGTISQQRSTQNPTAQHEACTAYQRSHELWQALQKENLLQADDLTTLHQVEAALKRCQ